MTARFWSVATSLLMTIGVLAAGTVSGSAVSAPAAGASPAVTLAAAACTDVVVVQAGGDGQAGSTSAGTALGRIVAATRAAAPDRSVASVSVPWSTRSARTLVARGGPRTPVTRAITASSAARWAGDVAGYADRLRSRLAALAADCPSRTLVLAGSSQGALAVHRVLSDLSRRSPAAARLVAGAVLVSDGYRRASTATPLGAPPAARASAGLLARDRAAVPLSTRTYPVVGVCTSGDPVCQWSSRSVRSALAAHASYASSRAAATTTAAGRVLGQAAQRTVLASPWSVRATVGSTLRTTLPLRVLAQDRSKVVVTATGLPAGVTMSPAGVLGGSPAAAGTAVVSWTARNTAAPWTAPATGSFVVTSQAFRTPDSRVSAGGDHTCSLDAQGLLSCWGSNDYGQLGTGAPGPDQTTPVPVGTAHWAQVAAGGSSTCGIQQDGTLWCWGLNHQGQLGDGTTTDRSAPVRVSSSTDWARVSADWWTTCATTTDGRAYCWGQNAGGQVGDGTTTRRLRPTAVPGTGWVSVRTAGWHTCGVRRDGTAACWGRNNFGELGVGNLTNTTRPTALQGSTWKDVAVSWGSSCGVLTTGGVRCWGRNDQGQLGDGTTTNRVWPQTVPVPAARSVAVGDTHACALAQDGSTWCWGSGDHGNLGTGDTTRRTSPVQLPVQLSEVEAGWLDTCGLTTGGTVSCWGENADGELGDGTTTDSASRPLPAPRAVGSFGLATFNQLGNNHTKPRSDTDDFAPAALRAQWSVQTWRDRDLSIVGGQETDGGQVRALQRAAGAEYAAWPGTELGDGKTFTSVWWRTSDWEAVSRTTFQVPFMTFYRDLPVVQLRSRTDPSELIWVVNVHNAPGTNGAGQRARDLAIEVPQLQKLVATGVPVFVVGDFNEQTAYCKVAQPTGLTSPRGGSVSGGVCTQPSGTLTIDWIFGPTGVWSQFTKTRDPLVARITDHHLTSTRVTLR